MTLSFVLGSFSLFSWLTNRKDKLSFWLFIILFNACIYYFLRFFWFTIQNDIFSIFTARLVHVFLLSLPWSGYHHTLTFIRSKGNTFGKYLYDYYLISFVFIVLTSPWVYSYEVITRTTPDNFSWIASRPGILFPVTMLIAIIQIIYIIKILFQSDYPKSRSKHFLTGTWIFMLFIAFYESFVVLNFLNWPRIMYFMYIPLALSHYFIRLLENSRINKHLERTIIDRTEHLSLEIIKHKKSKEALVQSEASLKALINAIPESAYLFDENLRLKVVNNAFAKTYNKNVTELIGQDIFMFMSPDIAQKQRTMIKHTFSTGEPVIYEDSRVNKEYINYIYPVLDIRGTVTGIAVFAIDITDRKQLEQQLAQAQKMEAIGQFAGGIAHDFNNILTAILGFAEIGLMNKKEDTILSNIQSSGFRAASLVKKLLGFSRKQIIDPVVLDVGHLIDDLENMLARLIGEDIQINKTFKNDIPLIFADPGQIEQILINLIVNARDAINSKDMPDGRRLISINLDKVKIFTTKKENIFKVPKGSYVVISVSDTGTGMDDETQSKIFEPFYTTKMEGKGTGLGLSTTFGIITQNKGCITVYSEIGIGTTFNIYWPVIEQQPEMITPDDTEQDTAVKGTETIVLVEDNEHILAMVKSGLGSLGYTVIAYADPVTALEEIPKLKVPFDMIITDVIMPHMNGKALIDKLYLIIPDLKVLFSSGYTDDHIVNAGILKKDVNFISKPYNLKELTKKIKKILYDK